MASILPILVVALAFMVIVIFIHRLGRDTVPEDVDDCPAHLRNADQDRMAKEFEVATQIIYFLERVCSELGKDRCASVVWQEFYSVHRSTYWSTGQNRRLVSCAPESTEVIIKDPRPFNRALQALIEAGNIAPGAIQLLPKDLRRKTMEYQPWR